MGNFGENLRSIRTQRGLSQEALAQLLGTSKQVISRYENGQRIPKVSAAAKYAQILGVSLASLNGESPLPHRDLLPVRRHAVPLLGETAEGQQIAAEIPADAESHCNFALILQDESMQPRFYPGDTVFFRSQEDVQDGRLAAIRRSGEILLRRVYHLPGGLQLIAENPAFPPILIRSNEAQIIGLAVRFSRNLI